MDKEIREQEETKEEKGFGVSERTANRWVKEYKERNRERNPNDNDTLP